MYRSRYSANPYATPTWTQSAGRRRCDGCGQELPPHDPYDGGGPSDWGDVATEITRMYAPLMEGLSRMWGGMAAPGTVPGMMPGLGTYPGQQDFTRRYKRKHKHGHRHDCGCNEGDCDGCHGDDCHCRCCIGDADLVIYARLGERRVVPLTLENPRRRERQVRLELSSWSTRGGTAADPQPQGRLLPPTEFTLASCEEREVILAVELGAQPVPDNPPGDVVDRQPGSTPDPNQRRLPDVDDCRVYYADLRLEGCDRRPVRIALVVLPRDCHAHPIDCGCGCC
jgi:hypothetical protein